MKIYVRSAIVPLSDESWMIRGEIARDSNTSADVLDELANTLKYETDFELPHICNNPNVSLETLLKLREKFPNSGTVEAGIAKHIDTPPDMLSDLVAHPKSNFTQCIVAKNPNAPTSLLVEIYNKNPEYREVKEALSVRSDVPTEIIDDILKRSHGYDYDDDILLNIMMHNDLTQEQFDRLGFLSYICSLPLHKTALFYANSDKASPEYLSKLASMTRHKDIKQAVYENPNTPIKTKEWLYEEIH